MEVLTEVGADLCLAVTLLDEQAVNKSGRVYLDEFCNEKNIDLLKVRNVNDQVVVDEILKREIDWLFIIGWSQIAKQSVLEAPKLGALGMHPTLLPAGRGRASIPWAILKGLTETGVTLFQLDEGVDTGPIIDQYRIPISETTTATELYAEVEQAHEHLMRQVIPPLIFGRCEAVPQDSSLATEWPGRGPADGLIDLTGSVLAAERLIRATTRPYPGAYLELGDHQATVWKAEILSSNAVSLESEETVSFSDGRLRLLDFEVRG
jgi:methionyl-tRNA formyltransferase